MVWRISPVAMHDSEGGGSFHKINAHTQNSKLRTSVSEQPPGSAQDSDGISAGAISGLYLHPAYKGSFELLAATINPPVITKPGMEDTDPQCMTSRIVGRGVRLVREDVE